MTLVLEGGRSHHNSALNKRGDNFLLILCPVCSLLNKHPLFLFQCSSPCLQYGVVLPCVLRVISLQQTAAHGGARTCELRHVEVCEAQLGVKRSLNRVNSSCSNGGLPRSLFLAHVRGKADFWDTHHLASQVILRSYRHKRLKCEADDRVQKPQVSLYRHQPRLRVKPAFWKLF